MMRIFLYILLPVITFIAFTAAWPSLILPLTGYWVRAITIRAHDINFTAGHIRFLREASATRYGSRGLSAIDPYARYLDEEVFFVPGKLFRREEDK